MSTESPAEKSVGVFSIIVGIVMSAVAILLTIGVSPMLLFARDSRDMTGGIAGAVLILIMLLTGIILVLRNNAPPGLMRAFDLIVGGLSFLCGAGILGWGIYMIVTGQEIQKKVLTMPLLFIGFGVDRLRRGIQGQSST